MELSKQALAFATFLLEAAGLSLSFSDIQKTLADCLNDTFPDRYCYVADIYGDAESGDVVYYYNGDTQKAPYEISTVNGKRLCTIHTDQAVSVLPRTVYDEEPEDADAYVGMEAGAMAEAKQLPAFARRQLFERFVPKSERDNAKASDFAGKNRSFPLLKKEDVKAAVKAMGRAGSDNYSPATIKANIIKIAQQKGWTSELPASWAVGSKEEAAAEQPMDVTGDVVPLREGAVGVDGTALLKLIAPGWGSSGYYSADMLRRDGPTVFKAGTKNFWNHQTDAEESARPEGDLRDLASVLTEDAHFDDNGPAGPGLYAKANVFEQYRAPVDSLAKHIGMSIRAAGIAERGEAEGRKGPIIKALTASKSVDYVTTPGAGGKILQLFEAARGGGNSPSEEETMDAAQLAKFQESMNVLTADNKRLSERLLAFDAASVIDGQFGSLRVAQPIKDRVKRSLIEAGNFPKTATGELDTVKLIESATNALKEECAYVERLAPTGRVTDLGTAAPPDPAAETKAINEAYDRELQDLAGFFCGDGATDSKKKAFVEGRNA